VAGAALSVGGGLRAAGRPRPGPDPRTPCSGVCEDFLYRVKEELPRVHVPVAAGVGNGGLMAVAETGSITGTVTTTGSGTGAVTGTAAGTGSGAVTTTGMK